MFELASFLRIVAFAVVFAGIEYRYVNRYEREWTKVKDEFNEKHVFWVITPYHLYLLLPLFIIASYSPSITAWAGNAFFLAVLEDVLYFFWRGRAVVPGDWTTTLFGSLKLGSLHVPRWWPLDTFIAAVLYWLPL